MLRLSHRLPQGTQGGEIRKKRVSNFDERTHYVIENKGSGKRTKPNEANFVGGKPLPVGNPDCSSKVPGFLWANTKCRRVRDQVGATHYALPNLSKAHRACSETTGSACRDGFTAFYTRSTPLFRDLSLARADASLRSLLARLARRRARALPLRLGPLASAAPPGSLFAVESFPLAGRTVFATRPRRLGAGPL